MYHGKPVFISKETCLPEIGADAAYYFDSFEAESMKELFQRGMKDFDNHHPIDQIKQRAAFFNWDKAASSYLNIYRQI